MRSRALVKASAKFHKAELRAKTAKKGSTWFVEVSCRVDVTVARTQSRRFVMRAFTVLSSIRSPFEAPQVRGRTTNTEHVVRGN